MGFGQSDVIGGRERCVRGNICKATRKKSRVFINKKHEERLFSNLKGDDSRRSCRAIGGLSFLEQESAMKWDQDTRGVTYRLYESRDNLLFGCRSEYL